jgi:hypothetical protein
LNAEVLKELNDHGRKHGLHKIELLEGVILTADEWYVVAWSSRVVLTFFSGHRKAVFLPLLR